MDQTSSVQKINAHLETHLERLLTVNREKEKLHYAIENQLIHELILASGESITKDELFKNSPTSICSWCLVKWNNVGDYRIYIEPEKPQRRSLRQLMKKDTDSLNKFQKNLVKKCMKNPGCNYLVTVCKFCQKKRRIPLKKPAKESFGKVVDILEESVNEIRRKKKKKKDLFAGLKPSLAMKFSGLKKRDNQLRNSEIKETKRKDAKKEPVKNETKIIVPLHNRKPLKPKKRKKTESELNKLRELLYRSVNQKVKPKSQLSSFLETLN